MSAVNTECGRHEQCDAAGLSRLYAGTAIDFASVYKSSVSEQASRPRPDCLNPPYGVKPA